MIAALLPIGVTALFLPSFGAQSFSQQGKALFEALSTLSLLYCLIVGARTTSDCISLEKREGTIGLLFLTDLKGYHVVLGKLASSSLAALYGLLAVVPILAQTLFLGGVTLSQVGLVALVLLNILFFSLTAGLFVSTVSYDARKAFYGTVGLVLLLTVGPFLTALTVGVHRVAPPFAGAGKLYEMCDPVIAGVSPLLAFHVTQMPFGMQLLGSYFMQGMLITHVASWVLLFASSLLVRGACREKPKARLHLKLRDLWNRWSFGTGAARTAFRARLLDRNPFLWLGARDRLKARTAFFLVGALTAIWLWGWWCMSRFVFDWDVSIWLLFFVYLIFKLWIASEVCMRFVEDRQCGALELILCSPLKIGQIAYGELLALLRQFGLPVLGIIAASVFLRWSALRGPHGMFREEDLSALFTSGLIVFVADLITLPIVAVHQSTYKASLNRALSGAYALVLFLPWATFAAVAMMILIGSTLTPGGAGSLTTEFNTHLWLAISLLIDGVLVTRGAYMFWKYFRASASERYGAAEAVAPATAPSQPKGKPRLKALLSSDSWASVRKTWSWRLACSALIVLALVLAVVFVTKQLRSHRLNVRIAQIQQSGQPVTVAQLRDSLPTVPSQENAGMFLVQTGNPLIPSTTWGPNGVNFQLSRRVSPLNATTLAFLDDWEKANAELLNRFHRAALLPKSRFPVDWDAPAWKVPSRLECLDINLRTWAWETALYLSRSNLHAFVTAETAWLGMARAVDEEPFLHALRLRGAALNVVCRALERVLNQQPLSDAQLQDISRDLAAAEKRTRLATERAFIGQRCLDMATFRGSDPQWLAQWMPPPTGFEATLLSCFETARHWLGRDDQELLYYLESVERQLRAVEPLLGKSVDLAALDALMQPRPRTGYAPLDRANRLLDAWDGMLLMQVETVARLRVTQAAIAVERYRIARNNFPDRLDEAVPEYLSAVPVDPFVSKPVVYRKLANGFAVYSTGSDRKDNGGTEATPRNQGRAAIDLTFIVER